MADTQSLSPLADFLISTFDKDIKRFDDAVISVNPVVAEVAAWYEKLRNAMDYRDDELVLRSAIERILKRRFLLGGNGKTIAPPLVRELIWARYFPDSSVPESIVLQVEKTINLYLQLQDFIFVKHTLNRSILNEWIRQLMSAEIQHILSPNQEKQLISNFMYQIFREKVQIEDAPEETRDAQVFISVRRAFAKDDLPLLRFHLFKQYFGELTEKSVHRISDDFIEGYKTIEEQLSYSNKDKIYTYIKNQTIPFFILEDILRNHKGKNKQLAENPAQLEKAILDACSVRYKGIVDKVKRAIIRGVVFILLTKAVFALAVEGTFENIVYGSVAWSAIIVNILIPPILMVVVGLLIKIPGQSNSQKILDKIKTILFDASPNLNKPLLIKKNSGKVSPMLGLAFILLWIVAFGISFGAIIIVLYNLHFNILSMAIFVFFLAIVSFISYRINQTAHMYLIKEEKQNVLSVLFDFFFMPFIRLGRDLTAGISQINIFLFIFDLIIEAPFKGVFAFFEQWFLYLRTEREKLE